MKTEIKIKLVNLVNSYANQTVPSIIKIFEGLVGKQLLKSDGKMMLKYANIMPSLVQEDNLKAIIQVEYSWLELWIRSSDSTGDRREYHETMVHLGSMKDGTLISIGNFTPLKADHKIETVKEMQQAAAVAKRFLNEAQKLYDDAIMACGHFEK